jgi:hypothetical protein
MMRIEFLQFLEFNEIPKIALLNKKINEIVDPNRAYVTTSKDGKEIIWKDDSKIEQFELKRHLGIIFSI